MMKRHKILLLATCFTFITYIHAETEEYYNNDNNFKANEYTFKLQNKGKGRFDYQEATQKDFENNVHPYFDHVKKLGRYFKNTHKNRPEHEELNLWNVIEGIESYSPREKEFQKWDANYTSMLSQRVTGVKGNDGSKHGLNLKGVLTKEGREAFILAAIHAGFNASSYQTNDTSSGYFNMDPVNLKLNELNNDQKAKIKRHRLAFQAFKNLMVAIENTLSMKVFKSNLSNHAGNQWPRIFKKDEISNDIYKEAVETVINGFAWGYNEKNDKEFPLESSTAAKPQKGNLRDCLISYKDTFIKLFVGATAINNDRMWGIVRDEYIDEEEKAELERIAKAAQQKETNEIKEANIFVGAKADEKKVDMKITGGGGQVIFLNDGGPKVYQNQAKNNDNKESVIVPFIQVLDLKKNQNDELSKLMTKKRQYLLVTGEGLSEEEAKKRQELYQSGKILVISTSNPETDGVFAYFPSNTDDNKEPMFKMIAAPQKDFKNSIAVTHPDDLIKFVTAMSKYLAGKGNEAEKPKEVAYKYPTVAVDIPGIDAAEFIKSDHVTCGTIVKSKFCGKQVLHATDNGKQYLWIYKNADWNDDKILEIPSAISINGKSAEELYKEGVFFDYDNALFYVSNTGIGKNEKTQVYALNAVAKEFIKDKKNYNVFLNNNLKTFISRIKK